MSGLVREHIPTELLNSQAIWQALLERMPMTAMIRNLAKMQSIALLEGFDYYIFNIQKDRKLVLQGVPSEGREPAH